MGRRLESFGARRGVEFSFMTASRASYGHKVSERPSARILQRTWVMTVQIALSSAPFWVEECGEVVFIDVPWAFR
jgi:hypothetical protein